MAAASIGKLNVSLTASANEFERTLDSAEGRLNKFGKVAESAGTGGGRGPGLFSVATLTKVGAGLGAAGVAAAGLFNWIKQAGDEADELADTAEVLGLAADDLAGLRIAGGGAGFDKAFEKFQRSISEAASGSKELEEAFGLIGLNARVLAEMNPAAAWLEFVDALGKVESSSDRINARMTILGKGSASVADKLAKGTEHWMKQLELTAGTQGNLQQLANAADEYEVASSRLSFVWTKIKTDVAAVAAGMIDAAAATKEFGVGLASGTLGEGTAGITEWDRMRERMSAQLAADIKMQERLRLEAEKKAMVERQALAVAQEKARVEAAAAEDKRRADLAERLHAELSKPILDPGAPSGLEFGGGSHRRQQIQEDRAAEFKKINAMRGTDMQKAEQLLGQMIQAENRTKLAVNDLRKMVDDKLGKPVAIP